MTLGFSHAGGYYTTGRHLEEGGHLLTLSTMPTRNMYLRPKEGWRKSSQPAIWKCDRPTQRNSVIQRMYIWCSKEVYEVIMPLVPRGTRGTSSAQCSVTIWIARERSWYSDTASHRNSCNMSEQTKIIPRSPFHSIQLGWLPSSTTANFEDFPPNFKLRTQNPLSLHCQFSANHVQSLLRYYINTHIYRVFFSLIPP